MVKPTHFGSSLAAVFGHRTSRFRFDVNKSLGEADAPTISQHRRPFTHHLLEIEMALNFDEMIAEAKRIEASGAQARIQMAVSTMQTDGVCMWASGSLDFSPGGVHGLIFGFPTLRSNGFSLQCYFSNRTGSDVVQPPNTIGPQGSPFFHRKTENMRFSLSLSPFQRPPGFAPLQTFAAVMKFEGTPQSFSVPLTRTGDLLTGIGPAIASGAQVDHAAYSFGFAVSQAPEIH